MVIYTSKRSKRRIAAAMCLHFGPTVFPQSLSHSQKYIYLLWLYLLAWCHCPLNLFNLVLIYSVIQYSQSFCLTVSSLIIISTWHLILLCLTPNKYVCIKKKCGIYSGNCASCHLIHIWAKTVSSPPPQPVWFLTVLCEFWCVQGFSFHMQALKLVLRRRGSLNVWSYWHQFDCIIISVCCTSCSHHCTYVCVRWEQ